MSRPHVAFRDAGRNFMTPNVIEYGWLVEQRIAYELSEGDWLSGKIWGVTVRNRYGGMVNDEEGKSLGQLAETEDEARELIEKLRVQLNTKEGASHGS